MAQTLSEAVTKFTVQTDGLQKGYQKAESISKSGSKSLASAVVTPLSGIKSLASTLAKTIGSGFGIGIGLSAAEALGATISHAFERIPEIAKIGKIAKNELGIDASTFSGIVGLAKSVGVDIDLVTRAMTHLAKNSKDTTGEIGEAFRRLNIDQQQFAQLDPSKQWFQLFDALSKGKDPVQRMIDLETILGEKVGRELGGMLGKTGAELEAQANKYAKSNTQIAAATLANASLKEAHMALEEAIDSVVIATTPMIQAIGENMPTAIAFVKGKFLEWGPDIMPILKDVAVFTGHIWDVFKIGLDVVGLVSSKTIQSVGAIIDTLGIVLRLASDNLPAAMKPAWIDNMAMSISKAGHDVENFGKKIEDISTNALKSDVDHFGETAKNIDSMWDKFGERRDKEIAKIADDLGKTIARTDVEMKGLKDSPQKSIERGSLEAGNLQARFQLQNLAAMQKQLMEQQNINKNLVDINKTVKESLNFGVV